MLTWLRRILFGWRAPVRLGQRRIALPIVFTALLVCCGGTFVWALVDSGLRQAGVLPTYTPTATRVATLTATAAPAPSATDEPTATRRPSRTPKPTATATRRLSRTPEPLATARPKATGTAEPSMGIGLELAEWDALGHLRGAAGGGFYDYDGGRFWVGLLFDERLCYLEQTFADSGVSLATARQGMAALLPKDAELVETYSPPGRPEAVVDLYHSLWLQGRFASDVWTESKPGEFIVLYKVFDDLVSRAIVACGNNP